MYQHHNFKQNETRKQNGFGKTLVLAFDFNTFDNHKRYLTNPMVTWIIIVDYFLKFWDARPILFIFFLCYI